MMAGRCSSPPRFAASVASVSDKVYLWGGKVDCGTHESETEKVYMYEVNNRSLGLTLGLCSHFLDVAIHQ